MGGGLHQRQIEFGVHDVIYIVHPHGGDHRIGVRFLLQPHRGIDLQRRFRYGAGHIARLGYGHSAAGVRERDLPVFASRTIVTAATHRRAAAEPVVRLAYIAFLLVFIDGQRQVGGLFIVDR